MVNHTLVSMTGFAERLGSGFGTDWVWEIRSVNGKGLDLRLRLPEGIEGLEAAVRAAVSAKVARGNVTLGLKLARGGEAAAPRVNATGLAAALDAQRCELIKDVPGYFTSDPNVDPAAAHLAHVSFARALEMASAGCDLVQHEALRHAELNNLQLILRMLDGDARRTTVSEQGDAQIANASADRTGDSHYGAGIGLAAAAAS